VIESAGAESRARLVGAILRDIGAVEPGIRVALGLAYASHGFTSQERTVVERIATAGGLGAKRIAELVAEVGKHADADPVSVRQSIAPARPPDA
jgi:hypothetical protein